MRKVLLALVVLGGIGAVVLWWYARPADQPPPSSAAVSDPRIDYRGPFRNIDPRVQYVGDAACADCHQDIVDRFRRHPMGRSLEPVAASDIRSLLSKRHRNPFKAFESLFFVAEEHGRVLHRQVRLDDAGKEVYRYEMPVHFVIGSGEHGKSFISNRDGYLFVTPISWYAADSVWDVSPGFPRIRLHGRPVTAECLFCHSNRADAVEDTLNRFAEPIFAGTTIGCERCHGPGELHWESRSRRWQGEGQPVTDTPYTIADPSTPCRADFTIVNPRHLPPRLRDAVCEQCHLGGQRVVRRGRGLYDFRPGLPLETCWAVFVDAKRSGQQKKIVNHVEQMHLSRCWQESRGVHKLTCISCHDPHDKPAPEKRVAWFRARCLACHGAEAVGAPLCSLPKRPAADDCVSCHMPRFRAKELTHGAFTDHRILRRADATPRRFPHRDDSGLPITHFYLGTIAQDDVDNGRDLGIALFQFMLEEAAMQLSEKERRAILLRAHDLLDHAVASDPRDWPAWHAKGDALKELGYIEEAYEAYRRIVEARPKREATLVAAAEAAFRLGRLAQTEEFLERLLAINPWQAQYYSGMARLQARKKQWTAALKYARKARELQPEDIENRKLLIAAHRALGNAEAARREFGILLRLAVDQVQRDDLTRWYRETGRE